MQSRPPPVAPPSVEEAIFESWAEGAAGADENEISFDHDIDSERGDEAFRTPARGERFNVLRPPQREPFRPPPPVPGPQGGNMREVGRVGRFAILSDDAQEAPRDYLAEARARLEDRMASTPRQQPVRNFAEERRPSAAELNARQADRRALEHETLPTAYDRLMNDDDPFEDDLE